MMSVTETAASLRELAEQSNAWPFDEARKVVARLKKTPKDEVIFETGYGPSGLPHIGTFGEVARTTMVPDPFGTHPSFGEHNNARLRAFLDTFGFEYQFMSSTQCYKSGLFDATLLKVLERFDAVMN